MGRGDMGKIGERGEKKRREERGETRGWEERHGWWGIIIKLYGSYRQKRRELHEGAGI